MHTNELIREIIISAVKECDYEPDALFRGIDAYAQSNGFFELESKFSENVIQSVVKNNLASVTAMQPDKIVLYFTHYQLIERVRLLDNQSLSLAGRMRNGCRPEAREIQRLESSFDDCMAEVCRIHGLREFLGVQISEIVLNIDYAKGNSVRQGQRLISKEGKIR